MNVLFSPSMFQQLLRIILLGLISFILSSHINYFYFLRGALVTLKISSSTQSVYLPSGTTNFQFYKSLKQKAYIIAIHINMKCFFSHTMHLRFFTFIICISKKQFKCEILLIKNKHITIVNCTSPPKS